MLHNPHILAFIRLHFGPYREIIPLAGDASVRHYFRVTGSDGTAVLCIDSHFTGGDPETYPFFVVHRLLSGAGLPVPRVFGCDPRQGLIFLEDGGDDHVQTVFPRLESEARVSLFRTLIGLMTEIQRIPPGEADVPFGLAFDVEKLMFEFSFFADHFLGDHLGIVLSQKDRTALDRAFREICAILDQPILFVLNHRDFHSRNILLPASGPMLIDFQDARMGLPQYDAVSLLRDAYLVLNDTDVETLKTVHFELLKGSGYDRMSRDAYDFYFDIQAFQRNVKALGTFGYQIAVCGNRVYAPYIRPTAAYLPAVIRRRSELRAAGDILLPLLESVL